MININQPLVSVVMPAYNAGRFIVEAINSILNQTYTNFELIVIDDASSDNTWKILQNYKKQDSRIRVFKNQKNLGVSATANIALTKAKGKFIARMDADDISVENRLQKQVAYLLKNPDVIAVGGQCKLIDESGLTIGTKTFPTRFGDIKKLIFQRIPMQQPSIMVNTNLLSKDFVWYDKNFTAAEEIELMFKFFQIGQVRNLSEELLSYRLHGSNTSLKNVKKTFYLTVISRIRGVIVYGFRPNITSILITIAQLGVVSILPSKLIYPVFSMIHGLKNATGKSRGTSLVIETTQTLAARS